MVFLFARQEITRRSQGSQEEPMRYARCESKNHVERNAGPARYLS